MIERLSISIEKPSISIEKPPNRIAKLSNRIVKLSNRIVNLSNRIVNLSNRIVKPSNRIAKLSNRIVKPSNRIAKLSNRIVKLSNRFRSVEIRSARIQTPQRRVQPTPLRVKKPAPRLRNRSSELSRGFDPFVNARLPREALWTAAVFRRFCGRRRRTRSRKILSLGSHQAPSLSRAATNAAEARRSPKRAPRECAEALIRAEERVSPIVSRSHPPPRPRTHRNVPSRVASRSVHLPLAAAWSCSPVRRVQRHTRRAGRTGRWPQARSPWRVTARAQSVDVPVKPNPVVDEHRVCLP